MSTKSNNRPRLRTRATALLLAFFTALASLGMLTAGTGTADAAPYDPGHISLTQYHPWLINDIDWTQFINKKPVYNDYLQCFNGHIYTDFVDPDGPDNEMTVELKVHRGSLTYTYEMDMSDGYHGVFFYKNMNLTHSTPPHLIESISLRAQDNRGAWSETVTADYDHSQWAQCL